MTEFFPFPSHWLVLGIGIYYRYLLKKSFPSPVSKILPFPSKAAFSPGGYRLLDFSQAQFIEGENPAVKGSFHVDVVALPRFVDFGRSEPSER